MVYISGAAEIAGGLGFLIPPARRTAALGLIALLVAVFPANVYMATNPVEAGASALPPAALWGQVAAPARLYRVGVVVHEACEQMTSKNGRACENMGEHGDSLLCPKAPGFATKTTPHDDASGQSGLSPCSRADRAGCPHVLAPSTGAGCFHPLLCGLPGGVSYARVSIERYLLDGWDKVRSVIAHYFTETEDHALAEDESGV